MATFKNCYITGGDSELILPYGYIEGSNDKFRSFVRISGTVVYAPVCGVVISVDVDELDSSCWMVTIQYSSNISVRLGHLETVAFGGGEAIAEGIFVGTPHNGELDVYLLTAEENPLARPTYVAGIRLWPHEATILLNDLWTFESALVYSTDDSVFLNELNMEECTNGRD